MSPSEEPAPQNPATPRASLHSVAARILLHGAFLLIAIGCFVAYEHFKIEGHPGASLASLVAAAGFGLAPLRDVVRLAFGIEGKVLHLVHGLGGLALIALPLAGVVSGAPVLAHAAMAPFVIMGAAQAVMHQGPPRNAKQAAALQRFAASLPEVAVFTSSKRLASPWNAQRAAAALSDILAKAQALGETELESDPTFQTALNQALTRLGAHLGLDAVALALTELAANPTTAGAVPELRKQLALARRTIASAHSH